MRLQTLQDREISLALESNLRGCISSVKGDRNVKTDDNKKILNIDPYSLYGWAMSESLPYDGIEMWKDHPDCYIQKLEVIVNTPDDSNTGQFFEGGLRYPDASKEKTKKLSILSWEWN